MAVLALAIGFFVFVYDRIEWGRHTRIRVYFHHAGSLHEGGAFVVAGKSVGTIESIALSPRGANTPLGGDEGVVVTVAIAASDAAHFDRGGDVFVASRGALAERYLELGPGTTGNMLSEGDQLLGKDPPSLDRVLQRTWDNLTAMAAFRDQVRPEFDALRANVSALRGHLPPELAPMVVEFAGLDAEIQTFRERAQPAHVEEVIARARAMFERARGELHGLVVSADQLGAAITRLRGKLGPKGDAAIASIELAIARVKEDIAKVEPLLAQVDALNRALARGDGSIMKIMRDPEFPEETKELGKIMKRQPWKIIDRPSK